MISAGKLKPAAALPGAGETTVTLRMANSRVSARSAALWRQRGTSPAMAPTTTKTASRMAACRNLAAELAAASAVEGEGATGGESVSFIAKLEKGWSPKAEGRKKPENRRPKFERSKAES